MPRPIPVEEQLKNAKAVLLMAETQAIVREAIREYAAEHFFENERAGAISAAIKQTGAAPLSTGKAVESVVSQLQGKFSYIHVIERLREKRFPLYVKNARTAVGSVLRRLRHEGIIREVQKGIAGKPSFYERSSRFDN